MIEEKHLKEKRKKGVVFYLIPVLLSITMLASGGLFLRDFMEYQRAKEEYTGLHSLMAEETEPAEETDAPEAEEEPREFFPELSIDYQSLEAMNPDFSSVLYVPALGIRYPVAVSRDNEDYLHKTFEGKRNYAGCIFLDANAEGSYDYANTFIFGHNMKNGTMFGNLKKLIRDKELAESDPYVYVYREGDVRKYRIFSYYRTDVFSPSYEDFEGEEGYDAYVKRVLRYSAYTSYPPDAVDFSQYPKLLTLSTCAGRSGSNERMLVHAALVSEKI